MSIYFNQLELHMKRVIKFLKKTIFKIRLSLSDKKCQNHRT